MIQGGLLQGYLHAHLDQYPEKAAITDGNRSIGYEELSIQSNKIAHALKKMGVGRQDRVALCLQRSIDIVVAMLGILKADAVYMPVDPKTPVARWACILADAAPKAIVCEPKTMASVEAAVAAVDGDGTILVIGNECAIAGDGAAQFLDLETRNEGDRIEPSYSNTEADIAYILYTSGSTGRPKGVMISHANVNKYIDWAVRRFNIGETDKILCTAPFHFDMSVFDIYCSLKAGATLCIASEALTLFPEKLVQFIEQQRITLWKGVSSLLMYMARTGALKPGIMQDMKQVLFAGETLPTKYLIDWMTAFPEKTFYNAYGPTETTGVSICYQVAAMPSAPDARIPIGEPREGTQVLLLSEALEVVPPDYPGEICIAGNGLARGYLNDSEKTSKAFTLVNGARIYRTGDLARRLPDGNLEYIGRKDRQLKFMGYRIEAGEIEQALLSIPRVSDAAVDLIESKQNKGIRELVAFWEGSPEITPATIAAELRSRLPVYMIPRQFIRVEAMPRCSRGKIDWVILKNVCPADGRGRSG